MNHGANKTVQDIEQKGFSTVSNLFSEDDIKILTDECKRILSNKNEYTAISRKPDHNGFTPYNNTQSVTTAYNTVGRDIAGVSKKIDIILERFLTKNRTVEILNKILGNDYKLYTCTVRQASHESSFVGLHQDADYQLSLSIFLNDIGSVNPTTVFFEGTHKLPFSFKSKFEAFDVEYFKKHLTPAIGKKGDVLFFLNKTLHGMKTSQKTIDDSAAIFLCFHPAGYHHKPWILPKSSYYNDSFLGGLGVELKRLLDSNLDLYKKVDNKLVIKRNNLDEERVIDLVAHKQNYSFTEYMKSIVWWFRYIGFFLFRCVRKIYKIATFKV